MTSSPAATSTPNGTAPHTAPPASRGSGAMELQHYALPTDRLTTRLDAKDAGRRPLVLCACGSFSPITYLHLRMFEMAKDWARRHTDYTVIGAYLSPVGDAYKKKGLALAKHRVRMCELAASSVNEGQHFIMVDRWEALQSEYQPTAKVLDHFDSELKDKLVDIGDGRLVRPKVALLAGADLVDTFTVPGLWSSTDLTHILCHFGAFIIERAGTDIDEAMAKLEPRWKENIHVIHQRVRNDISSTKIREFLVEDMSIRFLVPEPVIKYIEDHKLYTLESLREQEA